MTVSPAAVRAGLCAVLLSTGGWSATSAPVAQTFRTQSALVVLDVSLTLGKKPVLGVAAGEFEVLDNNVPQRVTVLDGQSAPIGVVLILDVRYERSRCAFGAPEGGGECAARPASRG